MMSSLNKNQILYLVNHNPDISQNDATGEFEIEFQKMSLDSAANLVRDINAAIELKTEFDEKLEMIKKLPENMHADLARRLEEDFERKCSGKEDN